MKSSTSIFTLPLYCKVGYKTTRIQYPCKISKTQIFCECPFFILSHGSRRTRNGGKRHETEIGEGCKATKRRHRGKQASKALLLYARSFMGSPNTKEMGMREKESKRFFSPSGKGICPLRFVLRRIWSSSFRGKKIILASFSLASHWFYTYI